MQVTSSPCLALCALDPATGHCTGCGRTLAEIAAWTEMSEPERLAVIAGLPRRFDTVPGLGAAREAARQHRARPRGRSGRRRL